MYLLNLLSEVLVSEISNVQAQFISKIEDEYQALLVALEPDIRDKYTQRCEEAVKEGGSKSVHVLGDWTIPPLITDENAFRIRVNEDA